MHVQGMSIKGIQLKREKASRVCRSLMASGAEGDATAGGAPV